MGWLMRALSQWRFFPESQLVSRFGTRRGSARNLRAHGCSSLRSPLLVLGISRPKKFSVSPVYRLFQSATRNMWLRIVFVFRRHIGSPDQCPKTFAVKTTSYEFFSDGQTLL